VQTAKTDFDMTERKTVVSAYLGGECDHPIRWTNNHVS